MFAFIQDTYRIFHRKKNLILIQQIFAKGLRKEKEKGAIFEDKSLASLSISPILHI